MNCPDHPILDQPWRWEIEGFVWHWQKDSMQAMLDVRFVREGQRRTVRFIEPQEVTIQFTGSYPIQCGEMVIRDISQRQLEGMMVQVSAFGASGTPIQLYAKAVQLVET